MKREDMYMDKVAYKLLLISEGIEELRREMDGRTRTGNGLYVVAGTGKRTKPAHKVRMEILTGK